jgi:HEAT repeat protein
MIKKIFIILLATMMLQNIAFAQDKNDQRTVTTKIADLLAQLPARDAIQLNRNMQEVAQLGEDGYLTLICGLTAPGEGNNALLEYAIGSFSAYVTQTGQEDLRKMSVSTYCKALDKLSNKENKSFLMSQLALVGKDDAISGVQGYLTNPELADPAARVMVKVNSTASRKALLNALTTANGTARLSIIEALGDCRSKEAVNTIKAFAEGNDNDLVKMSLYALANIADPSSEQLMATASEKSGYKFDNTNATAANLLYAEMLFKDGNGTLAAKIAKQLMEKAVAADQIHVRTSALKILVNADKEKSTQLLLDAVNDKNKQYRAAALRFAVPYITPNTTALWVKKLDKSDDATKTDIIYMFSESSAKESLPALIKLLNSKNTEVKLAAIEASTKIGQSNVLADLLNLMSKGDSTTVTAVSGAIRRMKGDGITEKVAAFIPKANPTVQIALINVLASYAANGQLNTIYSLLKNKNPEVKQAAFAALKQVVISDNVPQLFTLMNETSDQSELTAIQDAVIAALSGKKDNPAQVDVVLQQMATASADKKILFYRILASLGGDKSLNAVSKAFNTDNEQTQKAALDALASWVDAGSAAELIKIARTTKNAEYLDKAISGYLRSIRMSSSPADQKLLLLRNAMEVAMTSSQKQQILKGTEQAKTFNALVFAGRYLDDPELQQAAANAVMTIALADKYNGTIVKDLLNKTIQVLKGADSEYQKEAMRKYLSEMQAGEGFVSVFNGKDLSGWKGLVENPIARSKMDAPTLAKAQEKADVEMNAGWKVMNGELMFTGNGNNIATVKNYGDFEMLVDWKIIDDHKGQGDAGIYLRGSPQVQIWDNARIDVGAQVGSGGLYNNQVNESKPLKVADNKLDEWNTFHIIMKGDRVTVYLNGELVTDNVILENYWDRSLPIFAEEQIELQAHGSPVSYREIYIKEIPRMKPYELSDQEKKEGFKALFDGTNMHNWTGNTTEYIIENGNISIRPKPGKGSGGNLFTKEEFSDFIFRFEFQLTPEANNGVGIRAPYEGDAAYEGMEIQILDSEAPIYKDLHDYQYHGSIYGVFPAKRGFLKPIGEWNYEEIVAKGPKIKVTLNGTVIVDADITLPRKNGTADGQKHPGLLRDSGHIGFLGHGSEVQFRNIRVKDLTQEKSITPEKKGKKKTRIQNK